MRAQAEIIQAEGVFLVTGMVLSLNSARCDDHTRTVFAACLRNTAWNPSAKNNLEVFPIFETK